MACGRRSRGRRQAGDRSPHSGEEGGKLARSREQLPRSGAALACEAREPGGNVELTVAGGAPVPVDEERSTRLEAEVVASHVEVQQVITVHGSCVGGRYEGR